MRQAERLGLILEELAARGSVALGDLSERLGVSAATVRRDLEHLEEQHLLTRTHGGAVAQMVSYELPLRYKSARRQEQKRRIGQAAASRVHDGAVIGLTGGTTTSEVAREIVDRQLTVVTNALNIASELAIRPNIKLVVTGGVARPESYELVDLFDNRYGTEQSTVDGIVRATNVLLAGKRFVFAGYGWCGRGLASGARGMGAHVIITEVDPLKALEATMDGYEVMPMQDAAKLGDIFCTVTGDINVIDGHNFEVMKDGAIVANSGHFNVEINIPALEKMSTGKPNRVRPFVEHYTTRDGRKINIWGEGRLINLAAAEGHPASVMDMSFANQALSAEYMAKNADKLEKKVYSVPADIDNEIARPALRR